jgi:RsiW-degrading membrane proteinase PrsW (M82 family)
MSTYQTRFLTPPQESEETYPYRRVWRSIIIEGLILFGIVGVIFITGRLINPEIQQIINIGLCLTPFGLWLIFSWWAEQSVSEPRQRLLPIAIITALAASAIGLPFVENFLQVNSWLPFTTAVNRIVGYSLTVGITQEIIKCLVIKFTAWPGFFRTRLDGIAYGAASAIGYATVQNLHLLNELGSLPSDTLVTRILSNYTFGMAASAAVGYGLAEVRFGQPNPFFLTAALALAAFINGFAIPIRSGLVNSVFTLGVATPRPILGLGFSIAVYAVPLLAFAFLIDSAERRAKDAVAEEE